MTNGDMVAKIRDTISHLNALLNNYRQSNGITQAQVKAYGTFGEQSDKLAMDLDRIVGDQENRAKWNESGASEEMKQLLASTEKLFDNVAEYWRTVMTPAAQVAATLNTQSSQFDAAEKRHYRTSLVVAVLLALLLVGSAWIIYILFVQTGNDFAKDAPLGRIALLAVGRLAILALIAWTIRFMARLHRTHAEQSVIYKDRWAALQVSASILSASQLQQEKDLLLRIIRSYLDFSQNAFHAERNDSSQADKRALKLVRELAKSLNLPK